MCMVLDTSLCKEDWRALRHLDLDVRPFNNARQPPPWTPMSAVCRVCTQSKYVGMACYLRWLALRSVFQDVVLMYRLVYNTTKWHEVVTSMLSVSLCGSVVACMSTSDSSTRVAHDLHTANTDHDDHRIRLLPMRLGNVTKVPGLLPP